MKNETLGKNVLCVSQCGNCKIFLPLRYYMKSHLDILEVQKLLFLAIKKLWNLFLKSFSLVKMPKFLRNQNQETLNLPKMNF